MSGRSKCLRQALCHSTRARDILTRPRTGELFRPILRQSRTQQQPLTTSTRSLRSAGNPQSNTNLTTPKSRLQDLSGKGFQDYPRTNGKPTTDIGSFKRRWGNRISAGQTHYGEGSVTVTGRVASMRTAGSKLAFVDIMDYADNEHLQIVVNNGDLDRQVSSMNQVKPFTKTVQRGDIISVTGFPHTTKAGELSIQVSAIPQLLTPCLHQLPTSSFGDTSELSHERHVEMLTDPSIIATIKARSTITSAMHSFFLENDFINVQTPILAASAGGAIARSFETSATEFSDRRLALRIAPELWLKRLIIGGLHRVYELGPSFRNEGLDKTHNPEFTTCEFYATDWSLDELRKFTQELIEHVASGVSNLDSKFSQSIGLGQGTAWPQIDFLPFLNHALQLELPTLTSPEARQQVIEIFSQKNLPLPPTPTLPRLLDKLCSIYLEPRCDQATWIINTPECLSPLAKSFTHPELPNQRVAARAELFIHQKEVVNCYEEENSPSEQRQKFVNQQEQAQLPVNETEFSERQNTVDDEAMKIDDDYIKALEWGLPPTGGWGCGIDRLVMLMLGKDKISEVLTFGNLRMVTRRGDK